MHHSASSATQSTQSGNTSGPGLSLSNRDFQSFDL
jgi:hypothetical protein